MGNNNYTSNFMDKDGSFQVYMEDSETTTTAVNAVQFKMSSGNIDSGLIKMYGIK